MSMEARFGLTSAPFASETDKRFLVNSEAQRRALAHLRYGIKQGEGIVIITGDAGVGKSTLLDMLQQETILPGRKSIRMSAASVDERDIDSEILKLIGGPADADGEETLPEALHRQRGEGVTYSLLVDDGEKLSDLALERLRQLANLFHDGEALLQISIAGKTPFRSVLYRADMEKLRQRIIASYHLPPLTKQEAVRYLHHRIKAAGAEDREVFSEQAINAIVDAANGLPGQLNLLASNALMQADLAGHDLVELADVSTDIEAIAATTVVEVEIIEEVTEPEVTSSEEPRETAEEAAATADGEEPDHAESAETETDQTVGTSEPVADVKGSYPVSVSQINAAIESINGPAPQPVQPSAAQESQAKRPMSPQDMMMRRPIREAAEAKKREREGATSAAVPKARVIEIPEDVWDSEANFTDEEARILDRKDLSKLLKGFERKARNSETKKSVGQFVDEAQTTLDRLRATLKTLREETEKLESRQQASREKVGERIEELRQRLATIRGE